MPTSNCSHSSNWVILPGFELHIDFSYLYIVSHYQRYLQKETEELVYVLETPDDFQPEILTIVQEILLERKVPDQELIDMALQLQRKRIVKMLNELDPLNDELRLPYSHFINREKIKEMLEEEFTQFLENKEGFRFDVWKYSIGGL